jgi:hypothetical protein
MNFLQTHCHEKPDSYGVTAHCRRMPRGFALVVSLSMLVLLTMIAVG